jgi:predicted nuclease of predicted toxin-antitoxin system
MLAAGLNAAGYDAVHVRDRGMQTSSDAQIMDLAAVEDRVVVSADTDFGTLLATRRETKPSVIILRRGPDKPQAQLNSLLSNLPVVEKFLLQGSLVVIERVRMRIRQLPIC